MKREKNEKIISNSKIAREEFAKFKEFSSIEQLKYEITEKWPDMWHPCVRYKIIKKIRRYYLTNKT